MNSSNPFPGLRPFEASESHLFFGREAATDELLRKLRHRRFIAVVGTSGSGKSSLVRAGLLPDLYGGGMSGSGSRWRVAIFRPGDAPVRALALALCAEEVFGDGVDANLQRSVTETVLRRGAFGLVEVVQQARLAEGERLLVVVDQFEELFRIRRADAEGDDESQAFVKLLLHAAKQQKFPIYVMLTMRSEYLGECTRFRDLPEAFNEGQYLVPRMTRDQRRLAIEGPVSVAGAALSPVLVHRLLNDVGENPDQLPIMQHAMMRTWDIWAAAGQPDEPVTVAHYEATGTMAEALSRHADELYLGLASKRQQRIAERIFKRLTGLSQDQREMRYPTTLAELCAVSNSSRETVLQVINAFRHGDCSFLMPPPQVVVDDETLIDISHESLIRIWKRLQAWVDEEAQSVRIYRRLADDAQLHKQGEQGLRRNPELAIAQSWQRRCEPSASWARRYHPGFEQAMSFLERSQAAARRRKVLSIGSAIALPLMLLGGVTGFSILRLQHEKEEFATALDTVQHQLTDEELEPVTTQPEPPSANPLKSVQSSSSPEPERPDLAGVAGANGSPAPTGLPDAGDWNGESSPGATAEEASPPEMGEDSLGDGAPHGTPSQRSGSNVATVLAQLDSGPEMTLQRQLAILQEFQADTATADGNAIAASRIQRIEQALAESASLRSPADLVTCENVKRLEPVQVGDHFPPGRVYMLARVHAPREEQLTVNWMRDDGTVLHSRHSLVRTNTGRGFRTFSWKTFREPGRYAVQLLNEAGQIIGYREFTVGTGPSAASH